MLSVIMVFVVPHSSDLASSGDYLRSQSLDQGVYVASTLLTSMAHPLDIDDLIRRNESWIGCCFVKALALQAARAGAFR